MEPIGKATFGKYLSLRILKFWDAISHHDCLQFFYPWNPPFTIQVTWATSHPPIVTAKPSWWTQQSWRGNTKSRLATSWTFSSQPGWIFEGLSQGSSIWFLRRSAVSRKHLKKGEGIDAFWAKQAKLGWKSEIIWHKFTILVLDRLRSFSF